MSSKGNVHGYFLGKTVTGVAGQVSYAEIRIPAGIQLTLETFRFVTQNLSFFEERNVRFDAAGPAYTPLLSPDTVGVGLEYCIGNVVLPAAVGDRMFVLAATPIEIQQFTFGDPASDRFLVFFTQTALAILNVQVAFGVRGPKGR